MFLSLETHLRNICSNNLEYINLYATWELDKEVYSKALLGTLYNYPHYSLHECSHSKSIIKKIEMFLGEARIKELGPTETWLILQVAYLHDFGMVLQNQYVDDKWKSEEFQEYLKNICENSTNKDLLEAAQYILHIDKKILEFKNEEINWPIKVRNYVVQLISEYFRKKHAQLTKQWLNNNKDWGLDLSHNGLIEERLFKLAGELSALHAMEFNQILQLPKYDNGISSDFIHPRFIACLIRLGDLLDLDNGRFNSVILKVMGKVPELSRIHELKHASIEHFLVTPEIIEVTANTPNEWVYRETRSWFSLLKEEITNLTLNWMDIVPNDFKGYPPKLNKVDILLNNRKDLSNTVDLKFQISSKEAFELIEGSNIYDSEWVFIREFLQNSIDASKIQIWKDIENGQYDAWFEGIKIDKSMTPFQINKDIWKNYKIKILVEFVKKNTVEISIIDKGTGINNQALKSMSFVGQSWKNKSEKYKIIQSMPKWLRPTSAFGIGLQSAFQVTNSIKIETKADGECHKIINFVSGKENGYISVVENEEISSKRGTKVSVSFNYKNDIIKTDKYDGFMKEKIRKYDSFSHDAKPILWSIVEYIESFINFNYFPIVIENNNQIIYTIESAFEKYLDQKFVKETTTDGDYELSMYEDKGYIRVNLWEKECESLFYFNFPKYYTSEVLLYGNLDLSIKGIKVKDWKNHLKVDEYIFYINWSIMGIDSKDLLNISRNALRDNRELLVKLEKIYKKNIKFCLNKIKEEMLKGTDIIKNSNLDYFNMFIIYEVYRNFIDNNNASQLNNVFKIRSNKKIVTLSKNKEGVFNKAEIDGREFIERYPCYDFLFTNKVDIKDIPLETITQRLNEMKITELNNIIVDPQLVRFLRRYPINDILPIEISEKERYFIHSIYDIKQNTIPLGIHIKNDITYSYLMDSLIKPFYPRNCCEAMLEYKFLSVDKLPIELEENNKYRFEAKGYYLISPLLESDLNRLRAGSINKNINMEDFVNSVIVRKDFENVVNYVSSSLVKLKEKSALELIPLVKEQYMSLIREIYKYQMKNIQSQKLE